MFIIIHEDLTIEIYKVKVLYKSPDQMRVSEPYEDTIK